MKDIDYIEYEDILYITGQVRIHYIDGSTEVVDEKTLVDEGITSEY